MKLPAVSGDLIVKLGLGVAVLGAVGLAMWKIKSTVAANVDMINPASPDNVAYQTVNKGVEYLPGATPGATLGTWLYDITHPGE